MTSADVLASLNRWTTVAQRGKQTKEYVESISAPDASTIRIALVKPFAPLLSFLSLQTSAAIIIPAGNQAHPMTNYVGTGPFRFVERMPDRYVQLRRFEEYTPRDDAADNYGGRRVAYLDELRFVPVPDASTRLQGAIAGQFDYVDALPVENAPQLKGSKADAVIFKSFGWPFFFINAKQGRLTNVALRRAVLAALNFEDMLAAAFGRPTSTPSTLPGIRQVLPCILRPGPTTTPRRAIPSARRSWRRTRATRASRSAS